MAVNLDFDEKAWVEKCNKYWKNKEALNFVPIIYCLDGKLTVEFQNLEPKYSKKLTEMALDIAVGFIVWADSQFDGDPNRHMRSEVFSLTSEIYIQTLLEKGYQEAITLFKNTYRASGAKIEDASKIFQKNKEGLGFSISFKKNKGFRYRFENLDSQYLQKMESVAKLVTIDFLTYGICECIPEYAADADYKEEYQKRKKILTDNEEELINLLLKEGFASAANVLSVKLQLEKIQYEASHFHFTDGKWINAKGEAYEDGGFIGQNGNHYYTAETQMWETVFCCC